MTEYYYDACSLIYLTKIGAKELLPCLGRVNICVTVKDELLEDEGKHPDAKTLKENIDNCVIHIQESELILTSSISNLGKGEKETIEYCLSDEAILVCDDRQAVNYAVGRGLIPKTSEFILLDLFDKNVLAEEEFNEKFGRLATLKQLKLSIVDFFKTRASEIAKKKGLHE
jgi:predicted nucleic acid-binding protein